MEYKNDLLDALWEALTNDVNGTGGLLEMTDPVVGGKRFYRIKARME